ncbi:MAG: hypothetical protein VKO65_05700 [Cyanobacteriota bacterium]|nr:hypothetical protein [Cyanobacteriota bacterium]
MFALKTARRTGLRINAAALISAIAAGLWFLQFQGKYIDDAYITLAYARTLAEHGVWGTHPSAMSNAATSPISVILEACLIRIGWDPTWAIWLLNVATTLVLAFAINTIHKNLGNRNTTDNLLTTALIATSPLIASTLGLETYLYGTLYTLAIACYLSGRLAGSMAIISLLPLARPDGLIPSAVMLALLLRKRPSLIKPLYLFMLIPLTWLLFSWLHLGSLLPDTLFIKQTEKSWGRFSFANGLLAYLKVYPVAVLASLAPVGLLSIVDIRTIKKTGPTAAFLITALLPAALVSVAYAALSVPPYHWYYGFPLFMTVLAASVLSLSGHGWRRKLALGTHGLVVGASSVISMDSLHTRNSTPITTNWGTVPEYRQIALDTNKALKGKNFKLQGELGIIQFYSQGIAINEFSDRRVITQLLASSKSASNPRRLLLRLNFWHFTPPAAQQTDYILSGWRSKCDNAGFEVLDQWKTYSPSNPRPNFERLWCLLKSRPVR